MLGRLIPFGSKRAAWAAWAAVVVALFVAGLWARKWTYMHTSTMRHDYDIKHNYLWGKQALEEGVLNVYGNIIAEHPEGKYGLDYPPLRLWVMKEWAAWVKRNYGEVEQWREEYNFTAPILRINALAEWATSVGVFLLIWRFGGRWFVRIGLPSPQSLAGASFESIGKEGEVRGSNEASFSIERRSAVLMATMGAGLVWLSPASWMSAHGWPSSDVWVAPFYLFAVILACADWWFSAGVLLGIGAMFKGQELMVAPLFVLWPLMMRRVDTAARWGSGFVLAFAAIAAPWLLRDGQTHSVLWGAVVWTLIAGAVAGIACVWLRRAWWIIGGAIGAAILACPLCFQSDTSWWQTAFMYGAQKFPTMSNTTLNLATLLDSRFGWESLDYPVMKLGVTITIKHVLLALYAAGLVASAAGMAMHNKARDRRFLMAAAAPWIWAVAVMPQMHSRYLLFASTLGALAVGFSYWMAVMDLFLIAAAWIGVVHLLSHDQMAEMHGLPAGFGAFLPEKWADFVESVVNGSVPDLAWGVLGCASLYFVVALWRQRGALHRINGALGQMEQARGSSGLVSKQD